MENPNQITVKDNIIIEMPENDFEKVIYLEKLAKSIYDIYLRANEYREDILRGLEVQHDENYQVVPVFDARKTTDILEDELKNDNPELYKRCLSITAANAAKILGEDFLMKSCLKYGGEERTMLACKLTLGNMKKNMSKEEFEKYTREHYKVIGKTVEHK